MSSHTNSSSKEKSEFSSSFSSFKFSCFVGRCKKIKSNQLKYTWCEMTYFLLQNFQHLSYLETSARLKKKKDWMKESQKVIQCMILLLGHMTTKIAPKCNCLYYCFIISTLQYSKTSNKMNFKQFSFVKDAYIALSSHAWAHVYVYVSFQKGWKLWI